MIFSLNNVQRNNCNMFFITKLVSIRAANVIAEVILSNTFEHFPSEYYHL
jgi:hypothetical protein